MKIRAIKPFAHGDRSFAIGDEVDASLAAGKWLAGLVSSPSNNP